MNERNDLIALKRIKNKDDSPLKCVWQTCYSPLKCVTLHRYSPLKCVCGAGCSLIFCEFKRSIMERLDISKLLKWKAKSYRKPLIIEGARQVGKNR